MKTSERWKVVIYLVVLVRKTTFSLEKIFKAEKGQQTPKQNKTRIKKLQNPQMLIGQTKKTL